MQSSVLNLESVKSIDGLGPTILTVINRKVNSAYTLSLLEMTKELQMLFWGRTIVFRKHCIGLDWSGKIVLVWGQGDTMYIDPRW